MTNKQRQIVQESIVKMKEIANNPDTEGAHAKADDLLCEVLRVLGCSELAEEYENVEKWYA